MGKKILDGDLEVTGSFSGTISGYATTSELSALQSDVTTNTTNIAANTESIETNSDDIATCMTNVANSVKVVSQSWTDEQKEIACSNIGACLVTVDGVTASKITFTLNGTELTITTE